MATFSLVGAGPGDPDLLTLGAYKELKEADVVLYDRLVSDEILSLIPERAQRIYVGKREGDQKQVQAEIFSLLSYFSGSNLRVVRLKGGDPFIFGRGIEEWELLLELGQEVKVLPGVSSAIAVPAVCGIPLTARGEARGFAVITGHLAGDDALDWEAYAHAETLVVLMGVRNRVAISKKLIEHGRPQAELVSFVENSGSRVVIHTLEEVAFGHTEVFSPAVMVIGRVNRHYKQPVEKGIEYGQGIRS